MQYYLNRDVTKKECPWLDEDLKGGTVVYKFYGATYGCIGPGGVAVTFHSDGDIPFFEVPYNALTKSILEEYN